MFSIVVVAGRLEIGYLDATHIYRFYSIGINQFKSLQKKDTECCRIYLNGSNFECISNIIVIDARPLVMSGQFTIVVIRTEPTESNSTEWEKNSGTERGQFIGILIARATNQLVSGFNCTCSSLHIQKSVDKLTAIHLILMTKIFI